jgi:carboxyl-terminal processing protease
MTARELAEMKNDLTGEVVGIGVHISFESNSGHAEVLATLPGSPSEKAGLLAGDRIVTVNGKLYKDATLRQVVEDIRGKAGESVTLSVLRGDKLVSFTIQRARVPFDTPAAMSISEGVGYVRIPSFTDKTPGAVRSALEDLAKQHVSALVVDLRGCPGGSFERAVETAGALLAEGAPVVTLKRRGKPEEKHLAKGGGVLLDVPLAVLVDGVTGSSAELVTAALSENRHARIVGQKTLGKWTVQSVDELPNGWAFKYTVSLFKTPSGRSFEGVGLTPDVEVAMDEKLLAKANATQKPEDRLAIDVQLRTAKELLVRRP